MSKTNHEIFAEHHALNPETGKPNPGVTPSPTDLGCKCDACRAARTEGAKPVTE